MNKNLILILIFLSVFSKNNYANDFSTVCMVGCDFSDLNKAIIASRSGATILIKPEDIRTCGNINKPLKILGEVHGNRRPHLVATNCSGKGALIIESDNVSISNIEISGNSVRDKNGACIRIGKKAKDIKLLNIYCHDSQNGILASFKDGNLYVENSVFERCGFGGQAHGSYINTEGDVFLKNVKFLSSKKGGHNLKISAKNIFIENSVIAALNGQNSRAIDAFGGGVLVVRNSILQQGPNSENTDMIGLALEKRRLQKGKHSVLLENNWLIFDNQGSHFFSLLSFNRGKLFRGNKLGDIVVRDNKIVGMSNVNIENIIFENNDVFRDRKEAGLVDFDGTLNSLPVIF